VLWQCGSAFYEGRKLSNSAVADFHRKLNQAEYEVICNTADESFRKGSNEAELLDFLRLVHTRLGAAGATSLQNISINTSMNQTLITTRYNTTFSEDSAVEIFTWAKKDGALKLFGYHVQSDKFK